MITTGKAQAADVAAPATTRQATIQTHARSARLRRNLARLWAGRGWWGGLVALGLAGMGQNALVAQNDEAAAGRDFILAVLVLILSLLHPTWPWLRRRDQGSGTRDQGPEITQRPAVSSDPQAHMPAPKSTVPV